MDAKESREQMRKGRMERDRMKRDGEVKEARKRSQEGKERNKANMSVSLLLQIVFSPTFSSLCLSGR